VYIFIKGLLGTLKEFFVFECFEGGETAIKKEIENK